MMHQSRRDPLPHQDPQKGWRRDEPADPGLQHEAGDRHQGGQ
ncbi:MAG: hypothetical protein AVDCRST_MAG08-2138 [uncultured Acetobacteraceae bacterium]|uniref:Uncharacterized protein n=1 Tax=uncultured Acetobacteraceae bacterium TaxID=169975 RepID=A0A6J4IHH7_9PROT|nr:MAG: hypothetical protein AVDCRST_MAG08-2138 [uncultured Acetobacteraceae bacterium]